MSYDPPAMPLPKVGETRCYWALLSSELQFIYLDPVLQTHLADQADLLVGKSLLSFVHPDEQASAKIDLGGVLHSRTLHGSVTRVRFSRLSKVRRQLGYDGPPASWSDADKIALDSNYMAVDIVINWAAEGLVLCFIHAIVDLTPSDNDERCKTGWTNWCGTPLMDHHQVQLLYHRLLGYAPRPTAMNRVFQILDNSDGRPLLLSWPPDQVQRPNARDFAQLVENAQIGTGPMQDGNDAAKTSCTRRYKALQTTPSLVGGEVESIFIPHGSVIFACHKLDPSPRSPATMQQLAYQNYTSYYDSPNPYPLPPLSAPPPYSNYPPAPASAYAPQRWSQGPGSNDSTYPPPTNPTWGSPSPAHSVSSLPPAVSNLRSGSYPPSQWQQPSASAPSPSAFIDSSPAFTHRSASPAYTNSPALPANTSTYSPGSTDGTTDDVVPPARRRVSPASAASGLRDTAASVFTSSGRGGASRPNGVLKCSSCGATTSPEWRKGPSGKKELCNACGLRYARSRAKKEGHTQAQRRRNKTEKATTTSAAIKNIKREASASPVPRSPIPSSSLRRSFDGTATTTSSTSFSTAGSPSSSSDLYHPHPNHRHLLDEKHIKPSPSPPGGGSMSFVHYAPGGPGSQFYTSVPSPLSHTLPLDDAGPPGPPPPLTNTNPSTSSSHAHPLLSSLGSASPTPGSGGGLGLGLALGLPQLPPLSSYARQIPAASGAGAGGSFERDTREAREREREARDLRDGESLRGRERGRERERELPLPIPLGMGAEGRHHHHGYRRGILAQQG